MIFINMLTVVVLLFGTATILLLVRDIWDSKKLPNNTTTLRILILAILLGTATAIVIEMNVTHYAALMRYQDACG